MDRTQFPRAGLWKNPDFVKLWVGQTVSKFGSHITYAALSATAVVTLAATPAQMGVLGACQGWAVPGIGLLAGVWVDRLRRRPILIAADIGRALLLAWIPLAAWLGHLRMEHLYLIAALVAVLNVFFEVADQSMLPALVRREELIEANSKLGASDSVAEIAGPALGGMLVQWFTAPLAILIDCVSYLVSAVSLGLIRKSEPPPPPAEARESVWQEIRMGLRVVLHNPILRALAGCLATLEFFGSFIGTIYWLMLVREFGLSPGIVGLSIGVGGIGALFGAMLAGPITRRFGLGPTLIGALLHVALLGWIIPAAHGPKPFLTFLVFATQIGDVAFAIFFINATSLRQACIPHHLLGRANASMDFLARGVAPVGALIAGSVAGVIGLRLTWLIGSAGIAASALWLIFSPIRALREPPAALPTGESVA